MAHDVWFYHYSSHHALSIVWYFMVESSKLFSSLEEKHRLPFANHKLAKFLLCNVFTFPQRYAFLSHLPYRYYLVMGNLDFILLLFRQS